MTASGDSSAAATGLHPPDALVRAVRWMRRRSPLWPTVPAVFVLYAAYSLSRPAQFLTAGYDLGIFDQALRAYARFQAPLVPLKGEHFNLLGDHFHPILVTLVPFYWIWNDARVLLLAQAALIALSCVFVWRIGRRRFPGLVSWLLVVGYAIAWPLQTMADFDFHEVAFAVPLIAWALDALDGRKDRQLLIAGLLLLLVREDMGAIVLLLGVIRIFRRPRWLGALLIVIGAGAFILIVMVVMPAIAGRGYGYWDYSVLGSGAGDAVHTILTDPLKVVVAFFTPSIKVTTLVALFAPVFLLCFLSPYVLLALPLLAQRMLSDRSALWETQFHYNAPVWIILAIAAIDGLGRLRRIRGLRHPWVVRGIAIAFAVIPVGLTLSGTLNTYPFNRMLYGSAWTQTSHMQAQRDIIGDVPAGVCVTADDRLVPPLIRNDRVTVASVPAPRVDFFLLDTTEPEAAHVNETSIRTSAVYAAAIAEGYRVVERLDGIVLLQSPRYAGPTPECAP